LPKHNFQEILKIVKQEGSRASKPDLELEAARDEFVTQWGAIGGAWGINRTMAQIHALLLTSPEPLSTDEVMAELKISRGNAHANLRDLVGWGLIRSVIRKGERKEYFEAEKDAWRMFCTIARERKRREIAPALEVLADCNERTKGLKSAEAKEFSKQIADIAEHMALFDKVLERVAASEHGRFLKWTAKLLP
jgi:DNA-binding transcriptional regulator GbsR (MarR family)